MFDSIFNLHEFLKKQRGVGGGGVSLMQRRDRHSILIFSK